MRFFDAFVYLLFLVRITGLQYFKRLNLSNARVLKNSMCNHAKNAEALVESIQEWIKVETIDSLVPKTSVREAILEIKGNEEAWEYLVNNILVDAETILRKDIRPLTVILGEKLSLQVYIIPSLVIFVINCYQNYRF